jgi:hypothetical protein
MDQWPGSCLLVFLAGTARLCVQQKKEHKRETEQNEHRLQQPARNIRYHADPLFLT